MVVVVCCWLKKRVLNGWMDEKEEEKDTNPSHLAALLKYFYQSGHQGAVVFFCFNRALVFFLCLLHSWFLSRAALIRLRCSGAAVITLWLLRNPLSVPPLSSQPLPKATHSLVLSFFTRRIPQPPSVYVSAPLTEESVPSFILLVISSVRGFARSPLKRIILSPWNFSQ